MCKTLRYRPMEQPLLPVPMVASRLSVDPQTVRRLIAEGRLRAVRVGRAYRVAPGDLERFIAANRTSS
jgi:excisionase family DNA binding protein